MNIIEMLKKYNVIDLTHLMELDMPVWPTHPRFFQNEVESWDKNEDSYLNQLSFGEHTGTHVDAPVHFIKGGKSIADIDALHLISHAVKIDMSYIQLKQLGLNKLKYGRKSINLSKKMILLFFILDINIDGPSVQTIKNSYVIGLDYHGTLRNI